MIRRRGPGKLTVRDRQGFTVVEVLIAAAVVVVGLVALATMFPTGYSTVTKSGIQSRGLALAQQQIECLRNLPYDNINTTNWLVRCPVPDDYQRYTVPMTPPPVQENTPVTGAKQVTVTVTLPIDCPPDLRPCPPYGVTTPNCPDLTMRCIRLTSIIAQ